MKKSKSSSRSLRSVSLAPLSRPSIIKRQRVPQRALPYKSFVKKNRKRKTKRQSLPPLNSRDAETEIYLRGSRNGMTYQSNLDGENYAFNVVQAILKREEELKVVVSRSANTYTRPMFVCDLAHSFVRLRHLSVYVAEAIQVWRKPQTRDNPFFWEGENYIIKMFQDLSFLRSSRKVLVLFPFMLHCNPFFMFDEAFLGRVAAWSPGAQILLQDRQLPMARYINAQQILNDELDTMGLYVTSTGVLDKVVQNKIDRPASPTLAIDPFEDPHPGAALFQAHRKHVLSAGSMKDALKLKEDVEKLSQALKDEILRTEDLKCKHQSLERSLMAAASEGLTTAVSEVTEGLNRDEMLIQASLQDFIGGKRLRTLRHNYKEQERRVSYLKSELTIRQQDAEKLCKLWNMQEKEKSKRRQKAQARRNKQLEDRGMRMSKGERQNVHVPSLGKEEADESGDADAKKHITFEDCPPETSKSRKITHVVKSKGSPKKNEMRPFLTGIPNKKDSGSSLISPQPSSNCVGTESSATKNLCISSSSPIKQTTAMSLDLAEVDVGLFDISVWRVIASYLDPVGQEMLCAASKDVRASVVQSIGRGIMLQNAIVFLQSRIDKRAIDARISLDGIRNVSRDIQVLTNENIKMIYEEANKNHDRVARNIVEILVALGIATSSVDIANVENLRRGMAFFDKTTLSKGVANMVKSKISENKSDLLRRSSQLREVENGGMKEVLQIFHIVTRWAASLVEYFFHYKKNVKRIDKMVEQINLFRDAIGNHAREKSNIFSDSSSFEPKKREVSEENRNVDLLEYVARQGASAPAIVPFSSDTIQNTSEALSQCS